jgi:hypothetical protein
VLAATWAPRPASACEPLSSWIRPESMHASVPDGLWPGGPSAYLRYQPIVVSLPPQPMTATRCVYPKGTDRTGGRQRRSRVHGGSIKGPSKVHGRYTAAADHLPAADGNSTAHGPGQAPYSNASAHQTRQKIRDLAARIRHSRRQGRHGTGWTPWKGAVTRTAGSAPGPSAIRPQLPLHGALRRHAMKHRGTKRKRPA